MRERTITFPELALIGGTRGMLGVGIGLLLAGQLSDRQRKRLALPLIAAGALSTIPLAIHLLRKPVLTPDERMPEPALA